MRTRIVGYWVTTAIVALVLISGGIAQLARQRDNVEGMLHLGYPLYVMSLIGFWKVLGGIALVVPRFPRLKEWAYAGAFFELSGAAFSHAAVGDQFVRTFWPAVFAALTLVSWALRPSSRTVCPRLPALGAA